MKSRREKVIDSILQVARKASNKELRVLLENLWAVAELEGKRAGGIETARLLGVELES